MIRGLLISCIFIFTSVLGFSQQAGQSSLYGMNPYSFNPAFAGQNGSLVLTAAYRNQWVGIEGSPETQMLNAHLPLYILNGGFGFFLENHQLGAESNLRLGMSYNYWLPIGRESRLAFGVSGVWFQKELDGSKLRTPDGNYEGPTIDHQDDLLPIVSQRGNSNSVDIGISYISDYFEAGISATNILEPTLALDEGSGTPFDITLSRTIYIYGVYRFELSSAFAILPRFLVKTDGTQYQPEVSATLWWNDQFFGGLLYRGYNSNTNDALGIMAGVALNEHFTFGYGYDITMSALNAVSQGSHEILVTYNLNKVIGAGKPPKIIHNPRYWYD